MITVLMVIHFLIALFLAAIILLQKSDQGALAGLSSGGSMGGLSARGTASFLTRGTAILGGMFFASSLVLALLFRQSGSPKSLIALDHETSPAQMLVVDAADVTPIEGETAPATDLEEPIA